MLPICCAFMSFHVVDVPGVQLVEADQHVSVCGVCIAQGGVGFLLLELLWIQLEMEQEVLV